MLDIDNKTVFESFKSSDSYKYYKFNKDELDTVRIDLTFLDLNKNNMSLSPRMSLFESPSLQAVEFVKNYLLCFPEIKPLIHVLKRLLQVDKLNTSFNGKLFKLNYIRRIIVVLLIHYHFRVFKNEKVHVKWIQ